MIVYKAELMGALSEYAEEPAEIKEVFESCQSDARGRGRMLGWSEYRMLRIETLKVNKEMFLAALNRGCTSNPYIPRKWIASQEIVWKSPELIEAE